VTITEKGLEGDQQTRYFLRQPGNPDHGWPRGWTSKMVFTHPSPYRQQGHPAIAPWALRLDCRSVQKHNNHPSVHLKLSSLRT
jgi:uncharacterized Zn-finger protein